MPGAAVYTRDQQGDGGIFGAPTYDGDTSSRFPRAYACNADAGKNEKMGDQSGGPYGNYAAIWPVVGYFGSTPSNSDDSGSMTALDNPAGTDMIAPTRTPTPAICGARATRS